VRVSGRDQCAVRAGKENAACAVAGVSPGIRLQLDISAACESLRPRRQFQRADEPRDTCVDKKCVDAIDGGQDYIECWGSGNVSREFVYAADAAEGILLATEKYNSAEPVNIGSGFEIRIRELAEKMAKLTGFDGEIWWDSSKPDGQPRRRLDVSRAREYFGFEAKMPFDEGLRATIDWYRASRRTR